MKEGTNVLAHIVYSKTEFAHYDRPRGRSAESIHPDHIALVTHVAMPPESHPSLYRQPRPNRRREHRVAILLGLRFE